MNDIYIVGQEGDVSPELMRFLRRLQRPCIKYIFYDGREAAAAEFFDCQRRYFRSRYTLLTPGEYGCLMSHMLICRTIAKTERPALVFEADAFPRPFATPEHLQLLLDSIAPDEVVLLGGQDGLVTDIKTAPLEVLALKPGAEIWRAVAYVIGPRAAENLVGFQQSEVRRADDWQIFSRHGLFRLRYVDLFGHPIEPNPQMEGERSGNKIGFSRFIGARVARFFRKRIYRATKGRYFTSLGTLTETSISSKSMLDAK